jgi:hypothetical protein
MVSQITAFSLRPGTKIYLDRTYKEYNNVCEVNKKYKKLSKSGFVEQAIVLYCQKLNEEVLKQ